VLVSVLRTILEDAAPDRYQARTLEDQVLGLFLGVATQSASRIRFSLYFPIIVPEVGKAGDESHCSAIGLFAGTK